MQVTKSNQHTHFFNVEVAITHGLPAAIIISNLQFWIRHNIANRTNQYFGRTWSFNSARAFQELFPYMTERTISRTLKNLCDKGVLKKGNFNRKKFDKTIWYAFVNEEEWLSDSKFYVRQNGERISQVGESISQNGERIRQNGETIPDSKQQIVNPDKKHTQSACEFSFEKIFEMAFDSEFMRNLNEAHWGREVVEIQLERFKIKVRSSPEKYKTHNHESMRNAFLYHLGNHTRGNANGTQPELTKRQLNRQLNKQDPTKIIC